jgi:hypothetical protein
MLFVTLAGSWKLGTAGEPAEMLVLASSSGMKAERARAGTELARLHAQL